MDSIKKVKEMLKCYPENAKRMKELEQEMAQFIPDYGKRGFGDADLSRKDRR
jgi:hypothetical protein